MMCSIRSVPNGCAGWLSLIGMAIIVPTVNATTVAPIGVPSTANHAGQVIVGRVASVRSYWADNPRRIESQILLEGVQYLKGALPTSTSTFTLVVPGGTVGHTRMRIMGAPALAVGQRWILFLLPTYQTFPVVGLSAGAFRIQQDEDGVEHVYSAAGAPITGIDEEGMIRTGASGRHEVESFLVDRIGHTRLRDQAFDTPKSARAPLRGDGSARGSSGISYREFVEQLRPILLHSKDHDLAGPAGRRILVDYIPVPPARSQPGLRASGGSKAARVFRHLEPLPRPDAASRRAASEATRPHRGQQ